MKATIPADPHAAVRGVAGFWEARELGLVVMQGPDARDFLQRQTTSDVRQLAEGRGQMSAVLDPKAHVIAIFELHEWAGSFWIVVDRERVGPLVGRFEKYHISDEFTLADRTADYRFLAVEGPRARPLAAAAFGEVVWPEDRLEIRPFAPGGAAGFAIERSESGEDGLLLGIERSRFDADLARLARAATDLGALEVPDDVRETLRIEAGNPRFGADYTEEHILPATGLAETVTCYTKGCFPGQEVVARVKTYGAVGQGLVGLVFEGSDPPPPRGAPIASEGRQIGTIASGCASPSLGAPLAFALVARSHRAAGRRLELDIDGTRRAATVRLPPFHAAPDRRQVARCELQGAQREFAAGDEENAIRLARESILLDPRAPDAYETLGVILGRQERYDEAILIMKRLAEVNPEEPMAYANQSLYYMKLGDREAAEAMKGKAALASMRRASAEARQAKDEAAQGEAERKAVRERLEMFRQVLAIDPEDHLANFGLGKGLLTLDRPMDALPHLERAMSARPDHTVGYVELGKCLARLGESARAREVYEKGRAVATKRGDLMPLREIERALAAHPAPPAPPAQARSDS